MAIPSNHTDGLTRGWVSTDCGRGTIDILWSCLATIFLCVWTAIHLPVPYYREEKPRTIRDRIVRSKIVPALICVLVPEVLAITAIIDLAGARQARNRLEDVLKRKATLTHGYFVEMGGVCLRTPSRVHHQLDVKSIEELAERSGFDVCGANVSEDTINDLGKSDPLTKTIACVQTLWFVTQVLSRLREHKAITLLEVSTSAYVLYAVIAYAAWWEKPQDCSVPVVITCSEATLRGLQPLEHAGIAGTYLEFLWAGRRWIGILIDDDGESHPLQTGYHIFFPCCPIIFGAIHVASWNFTLPSVCELWMWRASSLFCLAYIPLIFLPYFFGWLADWPRSITTALVVCVSILYLVVRLYMIIEIFISLRVLPHSAYDSIQWSSFVPHI